MKSIVLRPIFWIVFALSAIISIIISQRYFSSAFPLVQLHLTADREQVMKQAAQLAEVHHVGPQTFSQAASFETDATAKNYVELEGGGASAFSQMLVEQYYMPYTWHVRHFTEFEKNEVTFSFKPDGKPYGFTQMISETAPGAALPTEQARDIATQASATWNVTIADYTLVESSKEVRPNGRIDHTFIYERINAHIGQGLYRLKLVVTGNKLTELTHFLKVPEAFLLRYKEMRSANNTIASGATMAMILLYILGGCIIGLFFLLRRRFILWRAPIAWGVTVAILNALTTLNQLPLAWMHYNTAISIQGFLLQFLVKIILQLIFISFFYSLIFATAESMTRAAFGSHIQLWHSWSTNTAGTLALLGRTIGGYLLVPLYLTFVVLFYLFTTRYYHWWTPSESLFEPNIIATYFPWLSPLVLSLGAGFMEECLFRAVPIAGSALIGQRYGNKRLWFALGFIVQALIFGAAHANYPAQPAYARVVELLFFSIINGLVYVRFGLLPAIIAHFSYDVVWFSLPLFISTAPYAWINQLIVIILALIPFWIVLITRLKNGLWQSLPSSALNNAFKPEQMSDTPQAQKSTLPTLVMPARNRTIIVLCGIIGAIIWAGTTQWQQNGSPLHITRTQAIASAEQELAKRAIKISSEWQPLSAVVNDFTSNPQEEMQHLFIWQQADKKLYHSLLGTYLKSPRMTTRHVTFSPAISTAQRAQEYQMAITGAGTIQRFIHQLPEETSGKQLSQQEARIIAHRVLAQEYHLSPESLQEVCATTEKKPARLDWIFVFAHPSILPMPDGQARIAITIRGDEVTDVHRYIHVPEEWERKTTNTKNMLRIIQLLCMIGLSILLCLGAMQLFKHSNHITIAHVMYYFIPLLLMFACYTVNSWPSITALFNTSEPFMHQAGSSIGFTIIGLLFKAGIFAVLLSALITKSQHTKLINLWPVYGVMIGMAYAGVHALLSYVLPSQKPLWANYEALNTYLPALHIIIHAITELLMIFIVASLLFSILDTMTEQWRTKKMLGFLYTLVCGIVISGAQLNGPISAWIFASMAYSAVFLMLYLLLVRYDQRSIGIIAGTFVITQLIQQLVFRAFPGALLGNALAILVLSGIIYCWSTKKQRSANHS